LIQKRYLGSYRYEQVRIGMPQRLQFRGQPPIG
jgi:hypothetical protein